MTKKNNKPKKFSFFLNGKFDYSILIVTIFLLIIGLIMLLSASTPTSISEEGVSYKYVLKQGEVALIGLAFSFIGLLNVLEYFGNIGIVLYFSF